MSALLTRLFGRLPIGWLQLTHNATRFTSALAGVAFANILVLMQLGFLGALLDSIRFAYNAMDADIIIQSSDANTLQDGSPIPRQRLYQALSTPGVASATAVYNNRLDWKQADGTIRTLDVYGIDPAARVLKSPRLTEQRPMLRLSGNAIVDLRTRNVPKALFESIDAGRAYPIEVNSRRINIVGTFTIGGGFASDGYMVVSDQTFLKIFRNRSPGAPNYVLVRLLPGADLKHTQALLQARIPSSDSVVRTIAEAASKDQNFQTTQRPIGVVFGFGIVIGALVGIVLVYQVLSTDVADHLREYATFKAIGYRPRFFLGIVFEEAMILAFCGFIPGTLIALGLYQIVAAATALPLSMPIVRPIYVLAGTIVMCTISGAIATRRLARADPADLF